MQRGRNLERGILDIAGLVAEDSAEKFLLGSRVGFSLRGNLTDKDIAFLDLGADTDDTVFVKVFGGIVTDIGNIAGQFFVAALGLTNLEGELFDMDRSVDVFTHNALGNHDSILEVVTLPRHEGDHHVAAESKLAALCGIALAEHLAFLHLVALLDN